MAYEKQVWVQYDDNKTEEQNLKAGAVVTSERMNYLEKGLEDEAEKLSKHISDKSNSHKVTAGQVGLGNVDNYATATQAEAEAGTATNRFMTPQRAFQAIAKWVEGKFVSSSEDQTIGGVKDFAKAPTVNSKPLEKYVFETSNYGETVKKLDETSKKLGEATKKLELLTKEARRENVPLGYSAKCMLVRRGDTVEMHAWTSFKTVDAINGVFAMSEKIPAGFRPILEKNIRANVMQGDGITQTLDSSYFLLLYPNGDIKISTKNMNGSYGLSLSKMWKTADDFPETKITKR